MAIKLLIGLIILIMVQNFILADKTGFLLHERNSQREKRTPGSVLFFKFRNVLLKLRPIEKEDSNLVDKIAQLFNRIKMKIKEPTDKVYNDKIWMNRFG